jgi:molybdopterin synthase catalytic subunit
MRNRQGLGEHRRAAYSRAMELMDKIKKWLGMGKKKA